MKKTIFIVLAMLVFNVGMLEAAVYKGQRVYVKKCRKCHGGGQELAASHRMKTWSKIMKKKHKKSGFGLAQLHLENKKAKKSWKYFKSKKYSKKAKHLKDFLVEYAKDSGNVPACN